MDVAVVFDTLCSGWDHPDHAEELGILPITEMVFDIDLRLTPDGGVWLHEANANPFLSYGARHGKMEYDNFIHRIVDAASAA
jgi:hypothetical protein